MPDNFDSDLSIDPNMSEYFTVMREFAFKLGNLKKELQKQKPGMSVEELNGELFERMKETYGSLVYNPLFKQMIDAESGLAGSPMPQEALVAAVKLTLKKIANTMDDMGLLHEATIIDDVITTF